MKKILLLVVAFLCLFDSYAQRKRRIVFDADVKTPVDSGFYGVGIVDNQAYLINHRKDSIKFKMEYPYVRAWSTGKDLVLNLTKQHPPTIFIIKDSVLVNLPSESDTLNRGLVYDLNYLGFRGGTGSNSFLPFNSTYLVSFNDTIRALGTDGITYMTTSFSSSETRSFFKLQPNRRFTLEIINNKWYLTLKDFEY